IIGFSNILLKSNLTTQQLESVSIIKNSSNNLLSIINDILDFSKLESGKLVFDKTPFTLREIIEETITILAPEAYQKDLELLLFIDENTPEYLLSDPLRLKQVFTNLLNNAIKFTPSGNIQIKVGCNGIVDGKSDISIQFCDTGIGLSGDQQKQIFKDFMQADASTTRQYGGTGLGLVIARRIIENMGGEIGVSSQTGEGSIFWINLNLPIVSNAAPARNFNELTGKTIAYFDPNPLHAQSLMQMLTHWKISCIHTKNFNELPNNLDFVLICNDDEGTQAPTPPQDVPIIYIVPYNFKISSNDSRCYISKPVSQLNLFDALVKGKPAAQSAPPMQFPSTNILAVDDTASNLHLLRSFLDDLGINVHTAQNGIEAVNQCKKFVYDLILMDLQMPLLDGVAASMQIKREGFNRHTPIIALSAYNAPSNPKELRDAGIVDYMSKPISEERVISAIQKYCSHSAEHITETELGNRPVDVSECLARTKNDIKLAKSMLNMLFETLGSEKAAIKTAYNENNVETLGEHIHSLKGACCYTGTPHLKLALVCVEDQLATENTLPDALLFDSLLAAMDDLLQWQKDHDIDIVFSS
ncbi:MAG: ATP-binding protein, partial [Spongiibacteraceae bacterium]